MALTPLVKRKIARIAVALILMGMCARCWVRASEWRNNGTLFAAAYRDQPNAVGPLQLYGDWLSRHGDVDRGIELLRHAIAIDPGLTNAHVSLGIALLKRGALTDAVGELQVATMQDPANPAARQALDRASVALSAQSSPELEELLAQADANPDDANARIALIERMREAGQMEQALRELAVHDAPFSSVPRWNVAYAVTLALAGRRGEAIERYRRGVAVSPDDAQVKVELAMMLLDRREGDDIAESRQLCLAASAIAPTAPNVLACRAEIAVAEGDVTSAIALYREAIHGLPPGGPHRTMFEQRLASLGG